MIDGVYLALRSSLGLRSTILSVLFFILDVAHAEGVLPNCFEERVIERRNSGDQLFFNNCERLRGKAWIDYVCVALQWKLALNTTRTTPEKRAISLDLVDIYSPKYRPFDNGAVAPGF